MTYWGSEGEEKNIEDLIGKTIIEIVGLENGSEEVLFTCDDGSRYKMFHNQSCCEDVTIDDVCGDVNDLLKSPITFADESSSRENPEGIEKEYQDSFTWTFYKLATFNGFVDIRWYGGSNGYYSEEVDFIKLNT